MNRYITIENSIFSRFRLLAERALARSLREACLHWSDARGITGKVRRKKEKVCKVTSDPPLRKATGDRRDSSRPAFAKAPAGKQASRYRKR